MSWLTSYLRDFIFYKKAAAYYLTMGPEKGRKVRKIGVPTDSVPEFELGDTASNIQHGRQGREEAQQQHQREEDVRRAEGSEEESHLQEEGVAEKRPRAEKN